MRLGLGLGQGHVAVAVAAAVSLLVSLGRCHGGGGGGGGGFVLAPRASNGSNAIVDMLPQYPSCSRNCYQIGIDDAPCSDTHCLCTDRGFHDQVKACVIASCRRADALMTKNMTQTACQRPGRDRSATYTVMSIVIGSVTSVVVAVRFGFKYMRRRIGTDDYIILSALLVGFPCTALNVQGLARNGIGKDVWTLHFDTVISFVFYFYMLEIFYLTMMALVKTAMCFFYLSIFPGTRVRVLLWASAVVNVLIGVVSVLTAVFQCTPVWYYWHMYTEPNGGKCIDIHKLAWVHGGINVAVDIWLIALPLSQVYKLGLHWKKKVGVIIMFLTGTFDTIVSILRLQSLESFADSWNPTYDQWDIAWWSTIEINIGLICTCLPTLRLILVSLAPRVFGSEQGSPRATPGQSQGSSGGIMVQKQVRVTSIEGSLVTQTVVSRTRSEPWDGTSHEVGSRHHSEAFIEAIPHA